MKLDHIIDFNNALSIYLAGVSFARTVTAQALVAAVT